MSHSFRKTPILGFRHSEKQDKLKANRSFRQATKSKLSRVMIGELEESRLPLRKEEVSNERYFAKAPRTFLPGLARRWTKK